MQEVYRGHEIVLLAGIPKSAVIFESKTGAELPTKIVALPGENESICLRRARQLVDLYLETLEESARIRSVG